MHSPFLQGSVHFVARYGPDNQGGRHFYAECTRQHTHAISIRAPISSGCANSMTIHEGRLLLTYSSLYIKL